jgi:flagellar hook-associated protein FlgK
LAGQALDHYWTDAWNLFIAQPSNTANTSFVRTRLRDLLKYLMNLSEYQLC